jgi:regulatory protein
MIITAVERERRGRRVSVFVDGELALTMGRGLAAEHNLRPGRPTSPAEMAALAGAEARRGALEAAQRLLTYRPRSERELRQRLRRRGFDAPVVAETLAKLREHGYVDDEAFAKYWSESRDRFSPRSGRLVQVELRRQGIAAETAEEATAELDDEDAAYRAAGRRLRSLRGLEYAVFRERLGGFLTRRGFSYSVARRTIDRCWSEVGGDAPEE